MSRTATLKKTLALLSMGGATFVLGLSGISGDWSASDAAACVSNADLVTFYQTVGDEAVAAFEDSTATALYGQESDFDNMVIEPVASLAASAWDNWVAEQFPVDVGTAANWVE